jgi:hypothetical protein
VRHIESTSPIEHRTGVVTDARAPAAIVPTRASRAWRLWLTAIFAVALLLRGGWVLATDTEIPSLSDPQYYHATATNIADGRGYSVAVDERGFVSGPSGESTAFWAPGYPVALAAIYAVSDSDQRAGKALNALAGALTVLPVFAIGRRMRPSPPRPLSHGGRGGGSEDGGGLRAAGLFALAPALVFWTPALFSEPLFTLGIATTIAAALWASDLVERAAIGRALLPAAGVGGMLAATAFVRSQGMLLLAPVAVLFAAAAWTRARGDGEPQILTDFHRGDSEVHAGDDVGAALVAARRDDAATHQRAAVRFGALMAAVVAGVALLVVPWAIRNDRAMGSPYLINDNLGYNLRLAHGPYSNGTSTPPQDLWDERPGLSFYDRELFFADEGTSRAITYAREHPGREATLAAKRVGWLLRSDAAPAMWWSESLGRTSVPGPRDALVLLGDVYWYALLALAAASLALAPRTRVWLALWSLIAVWLAMHLIFAGEPRYHVPLMPALCALAATTLVRFAPQRRSERGDP